MDELRMPELQIFLDEEDQYQGMPMHEHILRFPMHQGISGATMFKGVMGFGSHHHLQAPTKLGTSDALPLVIVFVDKTDRVIDLLLQLKGLVSEGLIVAHSAEHI